MIIAEQKPLSTMLDFIRDHQKVLVLGCGGCVTVCLAGGETEAEIVASALRLAAQKEGLELEISHDCVTRQCDPEYVDQVREAMGDSDAILTLACGVGVGYLSERMDGIWIYPGVDTKGEGATIEAGFWEERCASCGECILDQTGGICPIARCSKSLLNGPCGGSQEGKCEVEDSLDCGWEILYRRLESLGRLDLIEGVFEPKDWSKARDGGPRQIVREDVREDADSS